MPLTPLALIAFTPADRLAWRMVLRRVAADVCCVSPADVPSLPAVGAWVVVLNLPPRSHRPPAWAASLTTRTLLISEVTPATVHLARAIRHPVLIAPHRLADRLDAQLTLLGEMTAGIVHYGHPALSPHPSPRPH